MATSWRTSTLLFLSVVLLGIHGFSFPEDWTLVKESMTTRLESERGNGSQLLSPAEPFNFTMNHFNDSIDYYTDYDQNITRGFGLRLGLRQQPDPPEDQAIVFFPEEEESSNKTVFPKPTTTTTTTTTTTVDPLIDAMVEGVNITELKLRFGQSLFSARFGGVSTPPPPPAFNLSRSVWDFTLKMVAQGLYDPSSGNTVFSPVSILSLLNVLMLGATGATKTELLKSLGYPRYTADVHAQWHAALEGMERDLGVESSVANALFIKTGLNPDLGFRRESRNYYSADIIPVNFVGRPMTAMRFMNRYIALRTRNLIRRMFSTPVHPSSDLVAANTVYFKGSWEYPFVYAPPYDVGREGQFQVSANESLPMTFMTNTLDVPYLRDDNLGFEIASIPYRPNPGDSVPKASLFMMMPTNDSDPLAALEALEQTLPTINMSDVFERMQPTFGVLEVPKIKLSFQTELQTALNNIGITRLFQGGRNRDLGSIFQNRRNGVAMDSIAHKAVLKLTEDGTEAAAATVAFTFRMAPDTTVTFDRPFIMFIYDTVDNLVIFWARVVRPERNN